MVFTLAKILVVDDAAFMRMTIKKMVEAHDHVVVGEAGTGVEAIQKYQELKPDVILLDITMPEMNGVDAMKALKGLDAGVRVIICSAMGQQAMVAQTIQAGAKDFIVKPFVEERLIASIDKVLSK